jgi:fluoroacetyl-CoA thioesterase
MTDFKISPDSSHQSEMIVKLEDTASHFGSGLVEVFATPAMVALMENTAHEMVQKHLPETHITVGTAIDVKHLKATLVEKTVQCAAKLVDQKGNKLFFDIECFEEGELIGTATHTRHIVNKEEFFDKIL